MISVKKATLSGAKWGFIEKFSVQGIRFVLSIIMARLLSPGDYGAISMITVFIVISEVFVDSGFNNALIRKKEHSEDDYSTVFYFNLAIAIICYSILFIGAPFVATFYNMPILKSVLRVQSLSLIINSLIAIQIARLTIELNFKAIAKCHFVASLVSGIVGISFAYYGFGIWALVIQTLVSCLTILCSVFIISRWIPKRVFSRESFNSMFSYGSKLLLSNLFNKIYQNLYTLIIGKFYTAQDLGAYDRGAGLAAFPADTVGMIMQKVTFPILAKLQDDDERLLQVYKKYIKMLSMIIFFICVLLASLAKPLILIVLTEKWAAAIIFLQLYTFSVMFNHIDTVNLNFLFVKGRSDLVLKLEIIKKSLATLVLFVSVPFGVIAICLSKVVYNQINIMADSYYTGKFYGYGFIHQAKDVLPYFVFSLVSCLPGFLLSFTSLNNWIIIIIGCTASPVLYYMFLYKNPYMQEIVKMVTAKTFKVRTGE